MDTVVKSFEYKEFAVEIKKQEAVTSIFGHKFEASYYAEIDGRSWVYNNDGGHSFSTPEAVEQRTKETIDAHLTHPITGRIYTKSERQTEYPKG